MDRLPILGDLLIDLPPVIIHSVTKSRSRLRLKGLYWPALDVENGTPGGKLVLIRHERRGALLANGLSVLGRASGLYSLSL